MPRDGLSSGISYGNSEELQCVAKEILLCQRKRQPYKRRGIYSMKTLCSQGPTAKSVAGIALCIHWWKPRNKTSLELLLARHVLPSRMLTRQVSKFMVVSVPLVYLLSSIRSSNFIMYLIRRLTHTSLCISLFRYKKEQQQPEREHFRWSCTVACTRGLSSEKPDNKSDVSNRKMTRSLTALSFLSASTFHRTQRRTIGWSGLISSWGVPQSIGLHYALHVGRRHLAGNAGGWIDQIVEDENLLRLVVQNL